MLRGEEQKEPAVLHGRLFLLLFRNANFISLPRRDEDGTPQDCAANLDHIQTVSQRKIGVLITRLSQTRMEEVDQAICFVLGINDIHLYGN